MPTDNPISAPGTAQSGRTGIIDAHHHVWDTRTRTYPWMGDDPVLNQPYSMDDYREASAGVGVEGTVLVQTVGDLAESLEFLALAHEDDLIRGVVGWLDLTGDVTDQVDRLRDAPGGDKLVGIRHQVHDEPDTDWLLRDDVTAGLTAMVQTGLVYDLLLKPPFMASALTACKAQPTMQFVIDHMAKPDIEHGQLDEWAELIRPFGELEHVACKVSGILVECGGDFSVERITPYVQVVVDTFGPDRLLWGSDWPVSLLATGYADVFDHFRQALVSCDVTGDDLEKVLSGSARHWYGLG